MPHGHLTPLGRQLRTVLANLSTTTAIRLSPTRPPKHSRQYPSCNGIRSFHDNTPGRPARPDNPQGKTSNQGKKHTQKYSPLRSSAQHSAGRETSYNWKQPTLNTDRLSETVRATGHIIPQHPKSQTDLPPAYNDSPDARGKTRSDKFATISLQSILEKYMRDENGGDDPMRARWEPSYTPSATELKYLAQKAYTLEDVDAWSDIVLTTESTEAARKLAERVRCRKDDPLFVTMHFLGRECISAHALRTVITSVSSTLEEAVERNRRANDGIFLTVVRLIRHAREVWPQSLPSIVSLFIGHLQRQDATLELPDDLHFRKITFALNKIMGLVSLSTAIMPYKDTVFREMAIVPILQYMDAHDPPLQITRPGYRAVVRIQLAQRKTADEQQWAALKGLSWPPWKVDRTAMDASIGLEYGISRARATLFSMRSAGYAPLTWEKAAEVYTGWDSDGTPTVQRRALLASPSSADRHDPFPSNGTDTVFARVLNGSLSKDSTYWAARIDSTRTIQEAWACYLAWEDTKQPHDQNIYLTIMQKLQEDANTQRDEPQTEQDPAWDLLPGDTPRLSPLPPSTHLYTYTRTAPPRLDELYQMLRRQGAIFTGHCLAFLLCNSSLQTALARIKDSLPQHPELQAILNLDPTHDLNQLPAEIFTAAVQLLSRSGGYFLHDRQWRVQHHSHESLDSPGMHDDKDLHLQSVYQNKSSVIVRAIELLHRRPNCSRQTWVAVFVGLTRESSFPGLGQALKGGNGRENIESDPPEEFALLGAMLAYGMTRRLVAEYREHFSDLDPMAFYRFCLVSESLARSVWKVSLIRDGDEEGRRKARKTVDDMNYDGKYVATGTASAELRSEFASMVGNLEGDDAQTVIGGTKLPRLLFIPNPAMLHVYIRALGWLGDFQGLRDLVMWMREFREELEERKGRDRLGSDMFRKAVVALRVFLERAWRVDGRSEEGVDGRMGQAADVEFVDEVMNIVESVPEWEGWATDEEVWAYAADPRFDGLRGG